MAYDRVKYLPTVKRIPDELWNEIRMILPSEKPSNTIGRPVVSFRKVLEGILYVLRTGCQWKMLPKEFGSGLTCHRRFQQWSLSEVSKKLWTRSWASTLLLLAKNRPMVSATGWSSIETRLEMIIVSRRPEYNLTVKLDGVTPESQQILLEYLDEHKWGVSMSTSYYR